jgi:2-polyprenyl-6-hydroxyphenyl methylase/3-demethylubiquinone-9 3-methyltransferase
MKNSQSISGYEYSHAENTHAHAYLLPTVKGELAMLQQKLAPRRLFDLGCGNGSVGALLSRDGWSVTGVDPSSEGIAEARKAYPHLRFEQGSAYDDLAARYGQFPVVTSLEVVEHVYSPKDYARTLFELVEPGGTAIVSTPYHGYLKNFTLAITGKMDQHFTALWDHGHIKFWSIATLTRLMQDVGFQNIRFHRVGRIPALAKSMIAVAQKPPLEVRLASDLVKTVANA